MKGVALFDTEVGVNNDTRLRSIKTRMDVIPFAGEVVRAIAKQQYYQNKQAAEREMEQKLSARIRERVDAEAREKLSGVVERLNERVFDPLNNLMLDPQMIDARTTEKRFWLRLRLAGDNHLGSHTPAPRPLPRAWRACRSTSRCWPTGSSGCNWPAARSPCPSCRSTSPNA